MEVYERTIHIQSFITKEAFCFDIGFACKWNKHKLSLLQTDGKPKSSECSEEEILHIFLGVSNEICIVSINGLSKKVSHDFVLNCVRSEPCDSKSNVDANIRLFESTGELKHNIS